MSYTLGETRSISSNDYSEFGSSEVSNLSDSISSCLPGGFINNPNSTQLGLCQPLLTQKCSQNWDETCDTYLKSLTDKSKVKNFLNGTARKKYCNLSPGSNCGIRCEQFDPTAQSSPTICSYIGNDVINTDPLKPDYLTKCFETCDNITKITDEDPVINNCLVTGLCDSTLYDICSYTNSKNIPVQNKTLSKLCSVLNNKTESKFNSSYNNKGNMSIINNPDLNSYYNRKRESRDKISMVTKISVILLIASLFCLIYLTYFETKKR
jgi:hypothetical protein